MVEHEKSEKQLQGKLRKLYDVAMELHEKMGELLEEIGTLTGDGLSIGEAMSQARQHWAAVWLARYGSEYVWQHQKDAPHLKRAIKSIGLEELKQRMARYLRDGDRFYVQARHGFGLFVSQINRFAEESTTATTDLFSPVVGCLHHPACQSDQEHTKKRAAEMRA